MTTRMKKKLLASVLGAVWVAVVLIRAQGADGLPAAAPVAVRVTQAPLVDFAAQIQPILEANCLECHSQDKRKGGLSLATYADLLDGGRSGPILRPGKGADSLMLHRVTAEIEPQMPLDQLALSADEVALLRLWIDQGARPDPASPPAPPPWEAPLALDRPAVPAPSWPSWSRPVDAIVSRHLSTRGVREPALVSDVVFARRAYLDVWGLLPEPAALKAFVEDRSPDKRERLVASLLADGDKYAGHWISFWNDLLRNEDGVTYFSENNGRRSITSWLLPALTSNLPYDEFVRTLLNPGPSSDAEGFLVGVNWRGETSAAVTPWMQASQNTSQVFLGVNMKCNACHDSFISKWKLKDAYALAAFFSPEPKLQLFRCDVARNEFAEPGFLYPELSRAPASASLADRRAAVAAIFTDPRNGRMPRTLVNRIWERLLGHGIVPISDEMDGKPWSPELLDWLASDFVDHRYDVRHLIATILSSRAYQMPAVARAGEPSARGYVFDGPEVRRMTAEQFADAIGSLTGEWSVYMPPSRGGGGAARVKTASDPVSAGLYAREWRATSNKLTRALGRPIRDQVTSVRAMQATTLQALELVNGEILTRRLGRGGRRMIGELPPDPPSLYNGAVGGRYASTRDFDVEIANASKLWLVVTDVGSNAPERVLPMWSKAEFVAADGSTVPLSALTPLDPTGLRQAADPGDAAARVTVKNPSQLVYDISGKGFARFRGTADIENARSEVGSTLNPALRFFVFDAEPSPDRLVPPEPGLPFPAPPVMKTPSEIVDRVFHFALNRAPSAAERQAAEAVLADPRRPGRPSADGVADLLWAVLMKPEFQLIY
jgi:hypothetical protein